MSKRSFSGLYNGLVGGVGLGVALMTPAEMRRAVVLIASSLVNALLQVAVLVGLVAVIRFTVGGGTNTPAWLTKITSVLVKDGSREVQGVALTAAIALLVAVKIGFSLWQGRAMARFSAACEERLSSTLMRRTLLAPYDWLVHQNPERLRQHLFGFVATWSREFVRSLMRLTNDVIMAVLIIALLIWSQPVAGAVVTAVAGLVAAGIFLVIRPQARRIAEQKRIGILGANSVSQECIHGVKDVKMASAEQYFADLFDEQVALYAGSDAESQSWAQLPRHVLELVAYGAMIGAALYVVLTGSQSAAFADMLVLYALAAMRLMPVFSTLVGGLSSLASSLPIIHDLHRLIRQTETTEAPAAASRETGLWREVRLEQVSHKYQKAGRAALRDVSLVIENGKSYGIVGPSGAGKSTLIDVLAGLLAPTSGRIVCDGTVINDDNRRAWRSRFGYVSQRPFLIDASLKRNIVFGSGGEVDEARLQKALEFACLMPIVERLKGGVDGGVGPQGALLSGGERQRVIIARALYRGANILILDEATSSLDVLVEKEIAQAIAALKGHVTTLIVSHRLGLVRQCDEIWLFEGGALAGKGPHEQLLGAAPLYRKMIEKAKELDAA